MSEVKRYIIGRNGLPELHDSGEYVATSDYDALAAEAQALREEVAEYEALCNRQAELLSQSIVAIR
ncbi:hypothetical protein N0438_32770, partial [Pseudomonas aeruginosa]|nr:hypothetical protein [Pseudomonas aeruginosa]